MPAKKEKLPAKFDRDVFTRICWEVAGGKSLTETLRTSKGTPSIRTIYNWMEADPDAADMMAKARLLSAMSIEDDTIRTAKRLLDAENPVHKDQVRALDAGLSHMRWVMERRNPRVFGSHTKASPTVAIQINTNALGDASDLEPQSFELEVPIVDAEFTEEK